MGVKRKIRNPSVIACHGEAESEDESLRGALGFMERRGNPDFHKSDESLNTGYTGRPITTAPQGFTGLNLQSGFKLSANKNDKCCLSQRRPAPLSPTPRQAGNAR